MSSQGQGVSNEGVPAETKMSATAESVANIEPGQQTPSQQTPSQQTPSQQTPSQQTPSQQTPIKSEVKTEVKTAGTGSADTKVIATPAVPATPAAPVQRHPFEHLKRLMREIKEVFSNAIKAGKSSAQQEAMLKEFIEYNKLIVATTSNLDAGWPLVKEDIKHFLTTHKQSLLEKKIDSKVALLYNPGEINNPSLQVGLAYELAVKLKTDAEIRLKDQPPQARANAFELIWGDAILLNMYRLLGSLEPDAFKEHIAASEKALGINNSKPKNMVKLPDSEMIGSIMTVLTKAIANPDVIETMGRLEGQARGITSPADAFALFGKVMGDQKFLSAIAGVAGENFKGF